MPKLRALARPKRPHSAANARASRKVIVKHAGASRALLNAPFDMRSSVGKAYRQRVGELTAHLGGDPTVPQRILVEQCARLELLYALASVELARMGAFKSSGEQRAAYDAIRKAAADVRDVLKMLGLERRAKPVPTLEDYLREREER